MPRIKVCFLLCTTGVIMVWEIKRFVSPKWYVMLGRLKVFKSLLIRINFWECLSLLSSLSLATWILNHWMLVLNRSISGSRKLLRMAGWSLCKRKFFNHGWTLKMTWVLLKGNDFFTSEKLCTHHWKMLFSWWVSLRS